MRNSPCTVYDYDRTQQEWVVDERRSSCPWGKISTAPRDGTRFLLWDGADDDGETYKIAQWEPARYKAHEPGGFVFRGGWRRPDDESMRWLPLPPVPKASR